MASGIVRKAALPRLALLHNPDFPAVIITGFDYPMGKRGVEKL
jgi:hypothetical protein